MFTNNDKRLLVRTDEDGYINLFGLTDEERQALREVVSFESFIMDEDHRYDVSISTTNVHPCLVRVVLGSAYDFKSETQTMLSLYRSLYEQGLSDKVCVAVYSKFYREHRFYMFSRNAGDVVICEDAPQVLGYDYNDKLVNVYKRGNTESKGAKKQKKYAKYFYAPGGLSLHFTLGLKVYITL